MMDKRCSGSYFFLRLVRSWSKTNVKGKPVVVQHEPLENILRDKLLSELFHEWATQNLCSENLVFYHEVEKYKTIRDPNLLKAEAHRIHNKYVRVRSVAEVNLDYECRETIEMEMENPTQNIFDEAKFVVLDLIKFDLYLKFIDSDIYRNSRGLPSTHKYPQQRRRNIVNMESMPHLNFDQISSLTSCLGDPAALDEFLKFAYTEFSDAVVQFYLAVEQYEGFPSLEFACSIFSKYLSDLSDEEVDADPKIKKWIWQQLQLGQCPPQLFSNIKAQAYAVMVQDNFLRFQNDIISRMSVI